VPLHSVERVSSQFSSVYCCFPSDFLLPHWLGTINDFHTPVPTLIWSGYLWMHVLHGCMVFFFCFFFGGWQSFEFYERGSQDLSNIRHRCCPLTR
jgi:hypothetical protein